MIQRVQSIYLLVAALVMVPLYFLDPMWSSTAATELAWFTPVAAGLAGLVAVGATATVFLFANRERQRTLVLGVQMLDVALLVAVCAGLYLTDTMSLTTPVGGIKTGLAFMIFLPVLAYVLLYLARRAIKKDIELVKSMDRLR
jgi:hypothetical protein